MRRTIKDTDVRYAVKMWCLCVALPCLALCIIGAVATIAEAAPYTPTKPHSSGVYASTEGPVVQSCFSAASWDAIDLQRPCTTVTRPYEDGSSAVYMGTPTDYIAKCIIPNPYEERGAFKLECHRYADRPYWNHIPRRARTEAPGAEICFPDADWNTGTASSEDRPCDLLSRPQEDGSGRLVLGTMGADAAVCVLPNPAEESGDFGAQCWRVANR